MSEMEARAFLDGAPPAQRDVIECSTPSPASRPYYGYNSDVAMKLCEQLGDGETLANICKQEGMPHAATVYRWLATIQEFRIAYQCALYAKFDARAEECIAIADNGSEDHEISDVGEDGTPVLRVNKEVIERSKLRIDTRWRVMAKELPRKYADLAAALAVPEPLPEMLEVNPAATKSVEARRPEDHPLHDAVEAWRKPLEISR